MLPERVCPRGQGTDFGGRRNVNRNIRAGNARVRFIVRKQKQRLTVKSMSFSSQFSQEVEEESKKQRFFQLDLKIKSPGSYAEGNKSALTPG